jgi:P-type E1-E2 ATPase
MGLSVVMLTGDRRQTAQDIAADVGIDQVWAELSPVEKSETVGRLQSEGETVPMVGDGINDAPALTVADAGMAMGAGADIAIESADIVLVRQDIRAAAKAIRLARATLQTIHLNLFWAFGYNVILIAVAAGVLVPVAGWTLPPAAAAFAMAASSVSVVVNSLLLGRRSLDSASGVG